MENKLRIILVGKAASGKDYFRDWVNEWTDSKIDVSVTTRPMRTGEEDGYTYHFIDDSRFDELIKGKELFEYVEFSGKKYGTMQKSWEESDLFIFTPSGAGQIPESDRVNSIVVLFDMPVDIRRERLSKRSDWDSVERRIEADEIDFEGFVDYDLKVEDPYFSPLELMSDILDILKKL